MPFKLILIFALSLTACMVYKSPERLVTFNKTKSGGKENLPQGFGVDPGEDSGVTGGEGEAGTDGVVHPSTPNKSGSGNGAVQNPTAPVSGPHSTPNPASTPAGGTLGTGPGHTVSTFVEKPITSYNDLGPIVNSKIVDAVIYTEGVIRPRRRHENDMDFAKFNPFYWQGRESFFRVEDYTPKGQNLIKFFLRTEWPQNYIPTRGPDFSAIYKGDPLAESETTRSKFALNTRMTHISEFKNFTAEINEDAFKVNADHLKKGDLLIFEFRFFLDESNPDWIKQKEANPHNLSAYYSEFFRIKVGEVGLYIDDLKNPSIVPTPLRQSGGWLTTPTTKVEPWRALQQQSVNLLATDSQTFLEGRTWFHTDMVEGIHKGDEADDKPSVFFREDIDKRKGMASSAFNVHSCNTCHYNNGQHLLPAPGQAIFHTLVKTSDKSTGTESKVFGNQLQVAGASAEGTLTVVNVEKTPVVLADGTEVILKKNIFSIDSKLNKANLGMSIRRPLAMTGVGLLNNIPDATIQSLVGRQGGEVSMVNGKVARFGWKADQPKLIDQIAAAMRNDLGVRNDLFPQIDCFNNCTAGKLQLPIKTMEDIETYISLLGVPPRTNPIDPKVKQGEALFRSIGCANCHVPTLTTGESKFKELSYQTIQPFTDLLLHDLGPGLADESGKANARKWRTAPLWGLKNVRAANENHSDLFPPGDINILWTDTLKEAARNRIQLLHDGRAESIQEAVLWHGGEALSVNQKYQTLTKEQREAIEAFLWDI